MPPEMSMVCGRTVLSRVPVILPASMDVTLDVTMVKFPFRGTVESVVPDPGM
jgi:hypothetical protein